MRLAVLEWMLDSSKAAAKDGRTAEATEWQNRAAGLAKIMQRWKEITHNLADAPRERPRQTLS